MKLDGKTAVVTGGGLGIGLATARRLIMSCIEVTIWDINKDNPEKALQEPDGPGGRVFSTVCDVTDRNV